MDVVLRNLTSKFASQTLRSKGYTILPSDRPSFLTDATESDPASSWKYREKMSDTWIEAGSVSADACTPKTWNLDSSLTLAYREIVKWVVGR